jgi:hypothetical protein
LKVGGRRSASSVADMAEFPNIFVSLPLSGPWDLQTTRFPTTPGEPVPGNLGLDAVANELQ